MQSYDRQLPIYFVLVVSVVVEKMSSSRICSILWFCFITLFTSGITCTKSTYSFPRDSGLPCNCDRYTPMFIDSSRAVPVTVPELKIDITKDAQLMNINNGQRINSTLVKGNITVTGGCVYNKVYHYLYSLYRADGVANFTRTVGITDGIGTPVAHEIFMLKDGLTLAEAVTESDGFLLITIGVRVEGTKDNKKFERYASVLRKVRRYNATVISSAHDVLAFLLDTLPNNCYYCYPGAKDDPVTNKKLPVAIHINNAMKVNVVISYRQFKEVYMKVLNLVNQPMVDPSTVYAQGNRTVVEICDPVCVNYEAD